MHKSLLNWRTGALLVLLFAHIVDQLTTKHQAVGLAYVDPGAGLLAFQILGASVMGGFYLLRRKVQSLFSRIRSKQAASDTQSQPIEQCRHS